MILSLMSNMFFAVFLSVAMVIERALTRNSQEACLDTDVVYVAPPTHPLFIGLYRKEAAMGSSFS